MTGYYHEKRGKETGLELGDVIKTIQGRPVEELIAERLKYTPASNYPTQLRDIAPNLLRTNDSSVEVEWIRNGETQRKELKTFPAQELNLYRRYEAPDTCFRMIDEGVAYLHNGSLKRKYLPALWEEIRNTKGLIIDIRNYPTDFPIYELSSYLMPKAIPFVNFTTGSMERPGLFTYTKSLHVGPYNEKNGFYKGKIVILVNERSQSSAEFHAMAYRVHPNATVLGSTTAGADGNISPFSLPGGISTMISGIGVYYPDRTETQRVGIVPDLELKPTIRGIREGRDELLEKALELINTPSYKVPLSSKK